MPDFTNVPLDIKWFWFAVAAAIVVNVAIFVASRIASRVIAIKTQGEQ